MTGTEPNGRVAFITGGASGIGLATTERLLAVGWKVAVADRDEAALQSWSERATSPGVLLAPFDVTDEGAAQAAIARVVEALGGLDGLVNAAGIAADIPALDTPVELFRKILDVNVTGTFIVARVAARVMKERGVGGAIVNLSSVAGLRGSKGRSAYGASKGAVAVLTQVLATDLARYGIRVNAVAPGPVDTPMVKAMHTPADRALWTRHIPMRRYGTPAEIAGVIEFLLDGTRSGYMTGEIVAVDGGFRGAGIIADD